jgi:hypothetical protein
MIYCKNLYKYHNVPSAQKDTNIQVQEDQRSSVKFNATKSTPKRLSNQFLKGKIKRILSRVQEKSSREQGPSSPDSRYLRDQERVA